VSGMTPISAVPRISFPRNFTFGGWSCLIHYTNSVMFARGAGLASG
jgi:hypothetical protein